MADVSKGQRILGSGQYNDQIFSADGSKLYVIASTGVTVLDTASGATLGSYSFGEALSGADLSPDGTKLLIADHFASNDYARFFELDLTTGEVTKFSDSARTLSNSSTSVNFNDVAFLSNTTALVTAGNGGSGIVSFRHYDLNTGTWSAVGDGRGGELTPSDDHSHIVATYFGGGGSVFLPDGSVAASYTDTGANRYVSPKVAITSDGAAIALGGPDFPSGLAIGTNSFAFGTSPATATPYLANPGSLALSPDGHSLFEGTILVDLTTNQAVGAYGLHGTIDNAAYVSSSSLVKVSPDGHYLSVMENNGIELIDLTQATFASGPGADNVSGAGALYGFGGNDTLTSATGTVFSGGSSGMLYGGPGDDSYYINTTQATAVEYAGQGTDTVYSSVTYRLGANIENLVLTGTGGGPDNITSYGGFGNDLDNQITGSNISDTLDGGRGNDTLYGAGGDDFLYGGLGHDVIDGGAGNDELRLSGTRAYYAHLEEGDQTYLIASNGDAVKISNVEQVRFADGLVSFENAIAGTSAFNPLEYAASNPDLARSFGADGAAATQHYLQYGFAEGRQVNSFDPAAYLAANSDVLRAFGPDPTAALTHYLQYGQHEGRALSGFDAVAYLLSNPDLQAAGFGASGALSHWLVYGAEEGRAGDAAFGREQANHTLGLGAPVDQAIDQAGDHDWFQLGVGANQHAHVDVTAAFGDTVTLHDTAGHLLASYAAADGHIAFDVNAAGSFLITMEASSTSATGAYEITAAIG